MNTRYYRFMSLSLMLIFLMLLSSGCKMAAANIRSVSYNLGTEPDTIDPALSDTSEGADVIAACFEGLMRLDKNNRAIPGIAASYTRDSDVRYTFKLRDCKWSDGKPVTAEDFEYAWIRVLAPETGSDQAYQLFCIKNAEAYNKHQASADSVGIKAIDDKTIEVTLESPSAYFIELLTLPVYMPVREDIINLNPHKWTASPDLYICNGPFKMVSWKPGYSMEFDRNTNYYGSGRIKLNRLTFRMVDDPDEYLSSWESGDMDIIESPPASEIQRLMSQDKIEVSPYAATYFYAFNCGIKPLDDKRVRKALVYAIDRSYIINDVLKNGAMPADGFIPKGIPDTDFTKDFRNAGGSYINTEAMIDEARKLLTDAGYPEGENFPELSIVCNDTGSHEAIAKTLQYMWKKNLGITIKLKVQDIDTFLNSRASGNFGMIRQGWAADNLDPAAFMELFVSNNGNNNSKYSNPEYDSIVLKAEKEADPENRMKYLHEAETKLMDDMPVLPLYFYSNILCSKPYIKGIRKSPLGIINFDEAYVDSKQ